MSENIFDGGNVLPPPRPGERVGKVGKFPQAPDFLLPKGPRRGPFGIFFLFCCKYFFFFFSDSLGGPPLEKNSEGNPRSF